MSIAFAVPALDVWHDELWDTILDLSALLDDGSWVLVGGQAVVAHTLAHRDATRAPRDSDMVGRIVTIGSSLPKVTRSLSYLGFEPDGAQPPVGTLFRYRRDADAPASGQRPQLWTVHVVGLTELHGGDQALARRVPYQASKGHRAPWVPVPDLLSSVVYEASQFAMDTTDPFAHARDAAFLASLLEDPVHERGRLTPTDRRALRVLDAAVGAREHHVWATLPAERDAFTRWRLLLAV